MTTDFNEFVNKFQEETLKAVKQAQDANLAAWQQAGEMFAEVATLDKLPSFESVPSPTKFVELSFDYANKFLELRKQYAVRVTEMISEATKAAAKNVSEN